MRNFAKVSTVGALMAILVLAVVSLVMADTKAADGTPGVTATNATATAMTTTAQVSPCPAGWHQIKKTTEELKCGPNKPVPMTCPTGWKYVESLSCQSSQGFGSQTMCSGCEVGCLKIPVIK